jgi:hypothetical protein
MHDQQSVWRRSSVRRGRLRGMQVERSVRTHGTVHDGLLRVHERRAVCLGRAVRFRCLRRDVTFSETARLGSPRLSGTASGTLRRGAGEGPGGARPGVMASAERGS